MAFQRPHRSAARTAGKIFAWIIAIWLILVAALAVFVVTFDWNLARPWVDDKVSQALERPFSINGDLRVGWQHPVGERGWRAWVPWPRFTAYRVDIGNSPWASKPQFATLDEITFAVEVLPLIARTISVPSINLVNPSIDLERLADGRNNWTFPFGQSQAPSRWKLELGTLGFAKGTIALSDAQQKLDLQIGVDTLGKPIGVGEAVKQQEASSRETAAQVVGKREARKLDQKTHAQPGASAPAAGQGGAAASGPSGASGGSAAAGASGASGAVSAGSPASNASGPAAAQPPQASPSPRDLYALGVTAKGSYHGVAVESTGKIGSVLPLRDTERPFPLQADVKVGDTRLALVGTLSAPLHLAALDLRLWLQGPTMSDLYRILGVPLPDTPPYATDGRLTGHLGTDNAALTYSGFKGRMGGSDLEGTITYERRAPRPLIKGEVVSNLLRFDDLAPIVGAPSKASKAQFSETVKQPADRALPVAPFRTERWRAIDADVTFTGRRIVKDPQLPLTDLYTHVVLKDGALTMQPLKFGVAGGTLASDISLDGSAVPLKARISMSARHLRLKQLFPTQKTMQSALGELNGDAELQATGNSPAALAATLDGEAKALVTEGKLSRLLMEAAGLNVANIVYEKLFGPRDVDIHCGAADFAANRGVLDTRTFALDTDDALIVMDGRIDLRDESVDLKIHPHTKGLRLISLRSPLYVKGTFKNPDVGVSKGALALRAGAMVVFGLLNPFAALIPLIAPSHNQPAPCDELIAKMRKAPSPRPPAAEQPAQSSPPRAAQPERNNVATPGQGG
jgi:AsmA family protein